MRDLRGWRFNDTDVYGTFARLLLHLRLMIKRVALACLLTVSCSERQSVDYVGKTINNVVVICMDTVRFDTMDAVSQGDTYVDALTPLMSQAQIFTDAQSAAPWTIPSVASVITGLYPTQHGAGEFATDMARLDTDVPTGLDDSVPTLAETLRDAGFATSAVVAHPWFAFNFGLEAGFVDLQARRGREKIVHHSLEWLDNGRLENQRFFQYLHFMEVHDWHLKPEEEMDTILAAQDSELMQLARDNAPADICSDDPLMCKRYQTYVAALTAVRDAVARYLDGLQSRGLLDDTVVIIYSDHGEEFHDHLSEALATRDDPRDHYGFGHGQSLYQELIHVPLITWHPEFLAGRYGQHVSLVDIVPSILEWTRIDSPTRDLAGTTLTPALYDVPAPAERLGPFLRPQDGGSRPVYSSGIGYGPEQVSVREGNWKAIRHLTREHELYFDLANDPHEKKPINAGNREIMAFDRMIGDYQDLQLDVGGAAPDLTAEQVEKLKAIGYLQGAESKKQSEKNLPEKNTPENTNNDQP